MDVLYSLYESLTKLLELFMAIHVLYVDPPNR